MDHFVGRSCCEAGKHRVGRKGAWIILLGVLAARRENTECGGRQGAGKNHCSME